MERQQDKAANVDKENVNPIQRIEDLKDISVDSLEPESPSLLLDSPKKEAERKQSQPLVEEAAKASQQQQQQQQSQRFGLLPSDTADDASSTIADSPIVDLSFGPALVAASSCDSPAIREELPEPSLAASSSHQRAPLLSDGGGDQMATSMSPMIREAEEYADDLARELIEDSNQLVRSEHSALLQGGSPASSHLETHQEEPHEEEDKKDEDGDDDHELETSKHLKEIDQEQEKGKGNNEGKANDPQSAAFTTKTAEQRDKEEVDTTRKQEEDTENKDEVIRQDSIGNISRSGSSRQHSEELPDAALSHEEFASKSITTAPNPNDSPTNNTIYGAQQSFLTAVGNSPQTGAEKIIDMEFTKNYSDDLLMGQSEGAQQGESLPSGAADLADFELPPYSGSSSGSEPRHHSPVKRKSSSSSSAVQASSSLQSSNNVAPPDLNAVKNLLMSSYSRVSHVFHWKRPIETGVIFAIGISIIIALTFFSIISVVAYSALGVILASGMIRLYKTVMKTLNRSSETPFDNIWDKALGSNISMSPEKMHELVDSSLGNFNASLVFFKQVLLVEDKLATLKFGLLLYGLTYIGSWFNGMTLITICYLALFSVPIFYEKNKTKIDEYLNLASSQVSTAISMVTNKFSSLAFGSSAASSTNSGSSSKKKN